MSQVNMKADKKCTFWTNASEKEKKIGNDYKWG
jgi:hypothetical protein